MEKLNPIIRPNNVRDAATTTFKSALSFSVRSLRNPVLLPTSATNQRSRRETIKTAAG
jgi:hypothetical protein